MLRQKGFKLHLVAPPHTMPHEINKKKKHHKRKVVPKHRGSLQLVGFLDPLSDIGLFIIPRASRIYNIKQLTTNFKTLGNKFISAGTLRCGVNDQDSKKRSKSNTSDI